jgi:hypothetical protein
MTASPPPPEPPPPAAHARLLQGVATAFWSIAIAVILIHVWLKPHSNTLYKVFHDGGARWLAGQNLYPKVDEYIYSPFAAAFFAPFALLPDNIAGILWRILCLAAFAGAFAAWLRHSRIPGDRAAIAWILLLPLSIGDFFNGQANPLVIGLLMLAILACLRQRWLIAALCVAVATYFKVYPLAIGLLLCVIHPRHFPLRLIASLLALFLISLILQHPSYVLPQYANWIHSLRQDPRRTQAYFGLYRDFWLILRVLRIPITVPIWTLLQAASGAALALYLYILHRRATPLPDLHLLLLTLGTSWMLLFGPATESSTYIILAPPLLLATLHFLSKSLPTRYLTPLAATYLLLIASQMLSSWAHQRQTPYTHLIQPIATLFFTLTLLLWNPLPPAPSPPHSAS